MNIYAKLSGKAMDIYPCVNTGDGKPRNEEEGPSQLHGVMVRAVAPYFT